MDGGGRLDQSLMGSGLSEVGEAGAPIDGPARLRFAAYRGFAGRWRSRLKRLPSGIGTAASVLLLAQQGKQRGRLKCRVAFKLLGDPLPIVLKGIFARLPVMWTLEFGGEFACLLVFACGPLTHAGTRCCYFLTDPFLSFCHIQFDLMIVFHMTPSCLVLNGVIVGQGISCCRGLWPFLPAVVVLLRGSPAWFLSAVGRIIRRRAAALHAGNGYFCLFCKSSQSGRDYRPPAVFLIVHQHLALLYS